MTVGLHRLLGRVLLAAGDADDAADVFLALAERLNQSGYWTALARVTAPLVDTHAREAAPLIARARTQGGRDAVPDELLEAAHAAFPRHGLLAWRAAEARLARGDAAAAAHAAAVALPELLEDKNYETADEALLLLAEDAGLACAQGAARRARHPGAPGSVESIRRGAGPGRRRGHNDPSRGLGVAGDPGSVAQASRAREPAPRRRSRVAGGPGRLSRSRGAPARVRDGASVAAGIGRPRTLAPRHDVSSGLLRASLRLGNRSHPRERHREHPRRLPLETDASDELRHRGEGPRAARRRGPARAPRGGPRPRRAPSPRGSGRTHRPGAGHPQEGRGLGGRPPPRARTRRASVHGVGGLVEGRARRRGRRRAHRLASRVRECVSTGGRRRGLRGGRTSRLGCEARPLEEPLRARHVPRPSPAATGPRDGSLWGPCGGDRLRRPPSGGGPSDRRAMAPASRPESRGRSRRRGHRELRLQRPEQGRSRKR